MKNKIASTVLAFNAMSLSVNMIPKSQQSLRACWCCWSLKMYCLARTCILGNRNALVHHQTSGCIVRVLLKATIDRHLLSNWILMSVVNSGSSSPITVLMFDFSFTFCCRSPELRPSLVRRHRERESCQLTFSKTIVSTTLESIGYTVLMETFLSPSCVSCHFQVTEYKQRTLKQVFMVLAAVSWVIVFPSSSRTWIRFSEVWRPWMRGVKRLCIWSFQSLSTWCIIMEKSWPFDGSSMYHKLSPA